MDDRQIPIAVNRDVNARSLDTIVIVERQIGL